MKTESFDSPILTFVYLGKKIPSYAIANMQRTKLLFPKYPIALISDSYHGSEVSNELGIISHKSPDWEQIYVEIVASLGQSMRFRNGFWFKTMSRFFSLLDFQKSFQRSILHIEADNWLSSDFPIEKFKSFSALIAFPMENNTKGAASILYLKNDEASEVLQSVTIESILRDPTMTDMKILGYLATRPDLGVDTLPVIHPDAFGQPTELKDSFFTNNYQHFGGCFDALQFGQLLLGTDPRNSRGISFRFNEHSAAKYPSAPYEFTMNNDEEVTLSGENWETKLFNLHIHNKSIKYWSRSGNSLMKKRMSQYKSRERNFPTRSFYPKVFVSQSIKSLRRRLNPDR